MYEHKESKHTVYKHTETFSSVCHLFLCKLTDNGIKVDSSPLACKPI